jgi:hypothetical protein
MLVFMTQVRRTSRLENLYLLVRADSNIWFRLAYKIGCLGLVTGGAFTKSERVRLLIGM